MPVMVLDPNLCAGWEPKTPVTDSLLRRFLINWTLGVEAQGLPLGGRWLRRDDLTAVDVGRPTVGANVATLLAPLFPADVDGTLAALDAFYAFSAGEPAGMVFLFSPWPTPDLRPHGWTLLDHPPLMLRPAGGAVPPPPPGLRIEVVRDEETLRAWERNLEVPHSDPVPADPDLGPDEPSKQSMKALGNLVERITPWLFALGSWIFVGLRLGELAARACTTPRC